jgi:hypothetical protein
VFRKESTQVPSVRRRYEITCMSRFVVSTMARELIFGSLNSGFSSSPMARLSGSAACGRFSKLELGRGVDGDASSTTATSVLDILDLGILAQPCYGRRGPPSRLLIEFRTTNYGEFCQKALNSRGKSACGFRGWHPVDTSERRHQYPRVLRARRIGLLATGCFPQDTAPMCQFFMGPGPASRHDARRSNQIPWELQVVAVSCGKQSIEMQPSGLEPISFEGHALQATRGTRG